MSAGPYTIFRVAKQTDVKQATAASSHNYRKYSVANADELAPHPSPELLNSAERGYWELANERISEAGITPRRKDAVRCVEVMLSASPEWFERDAQGRAADYSNHKWTRDNLTYLQKTFGVKNVLAFKLHQDEKSPHIHALIVPITEDGRLSGRDVVGRPALRRLQTSYAEAMAEHGLRRGVEKSQAKHKPMKQFYGQQADTAQQVAKLVASVEFVPVIVKKPSRLDNLQQWAERQTNQVNDHFRSLLAAANQRAEVAASLAVESAAAKDQVRVLQKQLHTSEKLKQDVLTSLQESTKITNELAKRLAGGEPAPAAWIEQGKTLLDKEAKTINAGRVAIEDHQAQAATAGKNGDYGRVAELEHGIIPKLKSELKPKEEQLAGYAGGRDRIVQLDKEQAERLRERADQAAAARQLAEEKQRTEKEAAQHQATQARLADIARQQQLETQRQEREQTVQRAEKEKNNERAHVSQSFEAILRRADLVGMPSLIGLAEEFRIEVLDAHNHLVKEAKRSSNVISDNGDLRFRVVGSSNIFSEKGILPGSQLLRPQLNSVSSANLDRVLNKQEREQSQQVDKGLSR
jgi:hypothetical protein